MIFRRFVSTSSCQHFHLAEGFLTGTRNEEAWLPMVTWGWLALMSKVQNAVEACPVVIVLLNAFYFSTSLPSYGFSDV